MPLKCKLTCIPKNKPKLIRALRRLDHRQPYGKAEWILEIIKRNGAAVVQEGKGARAVNGIEGFGKFGELIGTVRTTGNLSQMVSNAILRYWFSLPLCIRTVEHPYSRSAQLAGGFCRSEGVVFWSAADTATVVCVLYMYLDVLGERKRVWNET